MFVQTSNTAARHSRAGRGSPGGPDWWAVSGTTRPLMLQNGPFGKSAVMEDVLGLRFCGAAEPDRPKPFVFDARNGLTSSWLCYLLCKHTMIWSFRLYGDRLACTFTSLISPTFDDLLRFCVSSTVLQEVIWRVIHIYRVPFPFAFHKARYKSHSPFAV